MDYLGVLSIVLCQFTGLAWILSPEPEIKPLPIPTIEEITVSQDFLQADNKGKVLLGKLQITPEIQTQIHQATIGQRLNPTWLLLRKGRLTASNFGIVFKFSESHSVTGEQTCDTQ